MTSSSGNFPARHLLRGFLVAAAGSFGVMAAQLVYAVLTSRLLLPRSFGAYAVGLSGISLVSLISGASIGQAVARREDSSETLDQAASTIALLVGIGAATLAFILAPFWSRLWGIPEAVSVTRLMAAGIPFTAYSAVLAGILRRHGRVARAAVRAALGQVVGVVMGLSTVFATRATWALGVASVVGLAASTAMLWHSVSPNRRGLSIPRRSAFQDARYAAKTGGMDLLRHATNLLPAWTIGRFVGVDALGSFNRATTMLTIPAENVQRSLSYAVFPEMRPGGPIVRSQTAFTDLMVLATWAAVIAGGIGYAAAGPFLTLLLGPTWLAAATVGGYALLIGVIPMMTVPMSAMLESRNNFKITLIAWQVGAIAVAWGCIQSALTASMTPAVIGVLVSVGLRIPLYLGATVKIGALDFGLYLRSVWPIVASQVVVTVGMVSIKSALDSSPAWAVLLILTAISAVEMVTLYLIRRKTAFGRVATSRGLPGF